MVSFVDDFAKSIISNDWKRCGDIIDENWSLKQSLTDGITNPLIDRIYSLGKKNGAWGAKLLGAGGGGFMLFFAPPEKHLSIDHALGLSNFPFKLETAGSQIIFNG
jgi:D-glycero-alpha-D-manno-heptose-7-phosphate kinase